MLRYKLRFNCFFKRSTVHRFLLWVLNKDFFIIIYLFYFFRSIISTLDHYGGPLWVIKTLATPGKCPEFGAHMQSHCGYATAVLVTGPLPCRPVTSGRDRAALFFKALNAVLDGHPPCQGLRPVARVSHPRVGIPHRPKDTFSRSLWTSLQGVLCYAQQWPAQRRTPSSGSACHPSEPYFQPTAAVLSWWVLQFLACCLCAEVRMRMTLRGPGGETEQGRDNNCLEHLQLSAYCDDSLCPYSCPQPANGSTCYSQSVWHFFVPELGWPHCASEEQILLRAAATPLLSAGLRSKALILAAVQWQVCFIQGCTAVMEGDASICGGEWRKQRGSEREGEKSWNQNTALFDATGDREGIRHKSFFSTMPAIIPTRRDLMMLTSLGGQPSLSSYGQQTLTTDCIKGLGRVHKEDGQVLILLAYFSWIFTSYGEDYVDCLSVSLEAAMLILGDDIIQLVVVIWFGMTWCSTFSFHWRLRLQVLLGMR